jgi:hypothetical protein
MLDNKAQQENSNLALLVNLHLASFIFIYMWPKNHDEEYDNSHQTRKMIKRGMFKQIYLLRKKKL